LIAGRSKSTYITNHSIPKPNQSETRINKENDANLENILELVEAFEFEKFFELRPVNISEESADDTVKTTVQGYQDSCELIFCILAA